MVLFWHGVFETDFQHLITRTPRRKPMTSARGNVTKTEVEMVIAATSLHVIRGDTEKRKQDR